LLVSGTDGATFQRRLDQLCDTADIGELVAFYRACLCTPISRATCFAAAEGIRTSMKAVFEAVAHRNPYPSEQLPEPRGIKWCSDMFIGSTWIRSSVWIAAPIPNWRACCAITRMNAGRGSPISPELWRCVARMRAAKCCVTWGAFSKKGRVRTHCSALALASSPDPEAPGYLWAYPELCNAVNENKVSLAGRWPQPV